MENIYLISTEDMSFIEEIESLVSNLDHEVKIVHTPAIPLRSVYVYNGKTQKIEKLENYKESDFPL